MRQISHLSHFRDCFGHTSVCSRTSAHSELLISEKKDILTIQHKLEVPQRNMVPYFVCYVIRCLSNCLSTWLTYWTVGNAFIHFELFILFIHKVFFKNIFSQSLMPAVTQTNYLAWRGVHIAHTNDQVRSQYIRL